MSSYTKAPWVGLGKSALVLGAKVDSGNIGDAIVTRVRDLGWEVTGDDCATTKDGARPPGGNIPNAEIAAQHGYEQGAVGHYQRYEVPSFDHFYREDHDALIVSLGATYKSHFAEAAQHELDRVLKACLLMPIEAAHRFVKAGEKREREALDANASHDRKKRHIILLGSYAHRHPFTNGTAYCAAKAGLDMAAKTMAWELTDMNYRVHVVHPFHVNGTPMWKQVEQDVMKSKDMTFEEADAYNRKDLKMPDLLTAKEVAGVVSALLSFEDLDWLSGSSIELNGGSR